MYIRKAEYLRKKFPEEHCLGGIITQRHNSMAIGTPCIVSLAPFYACGPNKWTATYNIDDQKSGVDVVGDELEFKDGHYGINKNASMKNKKEVEKAPQLRAIDLYEKNDIEEVNQLLAENVAAIHALFIFGTRNGDADYCTCNIDTNSFHFTGAKPLLFDNELRIELANLEDIYDKKVGKSFYELITENLTKFRYVNYTYMDVGLSMQKDIFKDIDIMSSNFSRVCPEGICIYQYHKSDLRILVDTVSISFYKLQDVMPIFDYRRSNGVVMEVFLANSKTPIKDLMCKGGRSAIYRFIFAKSKENIFTIDGEHVQRSHDISITEGMNMMKAMIKTCLADDTILKCREAATH